MHIDVLVHIYQISRGYFGANMKIWKMYRLGTVNICSCLIKDLQLSSVKILHNTSVNKHNTNLGYCYNYNVLGLKESLNKLNYFTKEFLF